jgi:hypothetical protein
MYSLDCRKGYENKEKRFLEKVKKTERCWIWSGNVANKDRPYGRIQINGQRITAHRLSYLVYRGDIPAGLCVCHTCDNPRCVNPDHLFLGSDLENIADCILKGRHTRGDKHGNKKLSEAKVREMRHLYKTGKYTQQQLADKYDIPRTYCNVIINRKQWKHVE